MAFVQNTTATYTKQLRLGLVQIANADASAQKTAITAGASGSKVVALWASSTELTANNRDVQVSIVRSATTYVLTTLSVPFSSGFTTAVPGPTDLLSAIPAGLLATDNDGQRYLPMESGDTLVVASLTTVTSGKIISVGSTYADF